MCTVNGETLNIFNAEIFAYLRPNSVAKVNMLYTINKHVHINEVGFPLCAIRCDSRVTYRFSFHSSLPLIRSAVEPGGGPERRPRALVCVRTLPWHLF
jgi:hypothetical protein